MHILKVIHGYPPDYNAGSEVYSKTICEELAKTHRVSVLTREENPYAEDLCISQREYTKAEAPVLFYVNNPNGKDGYKHIQMDEAFACLVDELMPDIAYIGHLNHLSTGIIDVLYEKKIPIVFMLHDFWLMCPRGQFLTRSIGRGDNYRLCTAQEDQKCACECYEVYFSGDRISRADEIAAWSKWIADRMKTMRDIVKKVDRFIAPSHYLRRRFIEDFGIPREKITYLDYGFPIQNLHPPRKCASSEEYIFGYIGTHIPAKGVNLLIQAFLQVQGNTRLKIFGRDNGQSTKALRALAREGCGKIEFCGEYSNGEIVERVFSKVNAIVVPSIWAENSPLVIHEAQECRIPVITADCGGMVEYVRDRENGLLFRHRDVTSLAESMQWAIDHPSQMSRFGERGYLFSDDGHVPDVKSHCEKLMEIFSDELRKRSMASHA